MIFYKNVLYVCKTTNACLFWPSCYPLTVGVALFCSSSSINNMPSGSDPADVNEDDKPSKNVIAQISQFADDNLTIVRVSCIFEQYMWFNFNGVEIWLPEYRDTEVVNYKLYMPAANAGHNVILIVLCCDLHKCNAPQQNISTCVGLAGLLIIARSIRLVNTQTSCLISMLNDITACTDGKVYGKDAACF